MPEPRTENTIVFYLPLPGWPRAVFEGDFAYQSGRLLRDGVTVLSAATRAELERGVRAVPPGQSVELAMRLDGTGTSPQLAVLADGVPACREDELRVRPSRSAWTHACQALAGSGAGFVASWLYLQKATELGSEWAFKMGTHMAAWHLLLTLTLFPASVWGRRTGIRAVQGMSLMFFLIHAGIALANLGPADPTDPSSPAIAALNAVSGVLFLVATVYGQRAYRDMDPVAALRVGRA